MYKKIKTAAVLLFCILFLGLAPAAAFASQEKGYDEAELKQSAYAVLESVMIICADENAYQEVTGYRDAQLEYILESGGYPVSAEDFKGLLTAWRAAEEECGFYAETDDLQTVIDRFHMEMTSDGVSLKGQMAFAQRSADVTFSFGRDGSLKALTAGGKYSTGEILKKAGLNTLIGMGTVFVVLILISLLISTFRYIPAVKERFSRNHTAEEESAAENAAAPAAAAVIETQPKEPYKIPDGAVVNVRVRESQVTYVTVRER